MGSQTPAYALPYPVASDRVRDGDNAIQALAERVEAVLIPAAIPVGVVLPYGGAAAPSGWILAQGQAVSRTGATAALYGVFGTQYGVGDGSTTFTMPDLRGRVPVGLGLGPGLRDRAPLGAKPGLEDSTLPAHAHTAGAGGATAQHSHSIAMSDSGGLAGGGSLIRKGGTGSESTGGFVGDHAHVITVNAAGASPGDTNMPPYIVLNYIVKL